LGVAYGSIGEMDKSKHHFSEALRIKPDYPEALNNLSWILATHKNKNVRNGAKAVKLAEKACKLTKYQHPLYLETLSAAYAETGDFSKAIKIAENAYELANKSGNTSLAKGIKKRLRFFKNHKPYHYYLD
jgi:tetratricopeptide (TPR) repeat protein